MHILGEGSRGLARLKMDAMPSLTPDLLFDITAWRS